MKVKPRERKAREEERYYDNVKGQGYTSLRRGERESKGTT